MKHNLSEEEWTRIYNDIDSIIVYYTMNEKERQDLYHDALLHVVKRFSTNYHEKGRLNFWIRKVVSNFCKDKITDSKRKNIAYYEELTYKPIMHHKHDSDNIKDKIALELLEESINELNFFDKQIIIGRLNKESFLSLANKANKNKNTIIKHFNKTLAVLRMKINQKYYDRYGTKYKDLVD